MDKLFAGLTELLKHATMLKVFAVTLLLVAVTAVVTVYENRQHVYDSFAIANINGDYHINEPRPEGRKLMQDLVAKYPNIAMISLIDADPIRNTRRKVYRAYGNDELRVVMEETDRRDPTAGDGPLFSYNEVSNKQMLAIMSGEFLCSTTDGSPILNFAGAEKHISYQCRVPLPPAFNKATGWFTIQLKSWPDDKIEQMKFDALNMSLAYYYAEIQERSDRSYRPYD